MSWISSFLKNRMCSVTYAAARLNTSDVKSGVPQVSVLGLMLFPLYTAKVTAIATVLVHSRMLHIHIKAEDHASSISITY